MVLLLRHLFFFFFFLAQCIAIPKLEPHDDAQRALSLHADSTDACTWSSYSLVKLCNSLIERIWPDHKRLSGVSSRLSSATQLKSLRARYEDEAVLRFKLQTEDEAMAFTQAVDTLFLDLWETNSTWADVRIAKKVLPAFLDLLPSTLQHSFVPVIPNLSTTIFDSLPPASKPARRVGLNTHMPHDLFFEHYQPLSVIYPWLRQIASMFPERTQLFTIGRSYEGRDIPVLRIGDRHAHNSGKPRPTILITSGTHAREWITPSTSAYILRSLLHNFAPAHSGIVNKLLAHYDLVFIPVLNPDGYDYTWTTDRLWRKTRQTTSLPFCPGLDLDRSFPMYWSGDTANDNPCSETYPGTEPLQAVEAQRLVAWAKNEILQARRNFVAFIDFHSYSQQILYPYSYSCDHAPYNLEDLEEVALGLSKAFRLTNGHYYSVDSACQGSMLSANSTRSANSADRSNTVARTKVGASGGSALDFFYQEMRVKYAFQIKLRDTGTYGFLLPRENIVPTGLEAFEAVIGLGKWLLGKRGIEPFSGVDVWGEEDQKDKESKNALWDDQNVSQEELGEQNDDDDDDDGEMEDGQRLNGRWLRQRRR